jgi:predicted transcriptional regulator
MKLEILKLLQEKYDKTSQGVSVVDISNSLNLPINELKIFLNELHKEKKISVRQGINGKLIYLKN